MRHVSEAVPKRRRAVELSGFDLDQGLTVAVATSRMLVIGNGHKEWEKQPHGFL